MYTSPSRVTTAEVPLLHAELITCFPSNLIIFLGFTGLGCLLPLAVIDENKHDYCKGRNICWLKFGNSNFSVVEIFIFWQFSSTFLLKK